MYRVEEVPNKIKSDSTSGGVILAFLGAMNTKDSDALSRVAYTCYPDAQESLG